MTSTGGVAACRAERRQRATPQLTHDERGLHEELAITVGWGDVGQREASVGQVVQEVLGVSPLVAPCASTCRAKAAISLVS